MRIAILALALLAPRAAHAWAYEGARWAVHRLPLEYSVGPSCRDFDDADTVALVQRVFQRWEDVDCSHVSFEYIGRGEELGLGNGGFGFLGDDHNNVSWCRDCLGGGGALGVAVLRPSDTPGLLDECDEYMEDNYEFTLDHDLAAIDFRYIDAEAVTAQESGHCLGLAHTDVERATMYPTYIPYWDMWTPDADDEDGLCWIYPMENGCEWDADCRDDTSCVEGVCLPIPPPPRDFGFPCLDASECVSGVCVVDPTSGENVCSDACDLAAPSCPSGGVCRRFGPCAEAFCVSEGAGDGVAESECGEDIDCVSGLCDEGHCRVPCLSPDGACPDGTGCWPVEDCGACRPGEPPPDVGTPCDANEDCPGRVCAFVAGDSICTDVCSDGECPEGSTCTDVQGTPLCIPDGQPLGGACDSNDDCVSELCAHVGDDEYCTRRCEDAYCPDGWDCVDASGYLICTKEPKPDEGCGCTTSGSAGASFAFAAIAIALLGIVRKKR